MKGSNSHTPETVGSADYYDYYYYYYYYYYYCYYSGNTLKLSI